MLLQQLPILLTIGPLECVSLILLGLPEGCTTVVVVRRAQTLDLNTIFIYFP